MNVIKYKIIVIASWFIGISNLVLISFLIIAGIVSEQSLWMIPGTIIGSSIFFAPLSILILIFGMKQMRTGKISRVTSMMAALPIAIFVVGFIISFIIVFLHPPGMGAG